jgi:hypothetical protein
MEITEKERKYVLNNTRPSLTPIDDESQKTTDVRNRLRTDLNLSMRPWDLNFHNLSVEIQRIQKYFGGLEVNLPWKQESG